MEVSAASGPENALNHATKAANRSEHDLSLENVTSAADMAKVLADGRHSDVGI